VFILKLLGGAALEGPEGPVAGRPAQKRRLALLALLTMSRTGRVGREKLATYLWPDSDAERSRHLLSDAVYVLNRALGGDAITGIGDDLLLTPDRLACDARRFESALERGDVEEAARLYAGPFLDGFFLDGSEAFERWAAAERDRLAARFASALERLAAARDAAGDAQGAAEAWRRLAAEDPFNSRVAAGFARALDRGGDRAAALQHLHAHVGLLRNELGLGATPELLASIETLTAQPPARPAPAPSTERPSSAAAAAPPDAAPPAPAPPAAASWLMPAAALALVLLAIGGWLLLRPARSAATALQSIAVMPFASLGAPDESRYFGEGMAEELATRLGRAGGLKVAARTSAVAVHGRSMDAREIGRALNVDALVEGSVRQAEGKLRIAVRLINARDGYQIWSHSWDRPSDDVLAVQDEIAGSVMRALRGDPAPAAAGAARAVAPEAYDLYLQGRYLWHQRTHESLARAAGLFERAVSLAPGYAEAYSGLADAYAVMGFYDYLAPAEAFPRAREAARRALAIDPQLTQAYASLGYVALYYDWNWQEAEAAFERAIELNPSYSVGHQWHANYLTARGRFDEAAAAMRRAQEVDPLSLIASAALGWVHFFGRDYDAAVDQCRQTLALNPQFELAHLWSGWAHEAAGRYAQALESLDTAVRLSKRSAIALASLGRAQAMAGDRPQARRTLAALEREHAGYLPAYETAKLHLALGDAREALRWLRRAHEQRSHSMVFLAVDPQLDALRNDPGFRDLMTATGVSSGR
jgi:TolB-like protein/DNA-binding SARP family transcriptional activator/Tfp pilus assembly protein PilF